MDLQQVRVQNYKCIEDSGWVAFERVTCMVGKNESGKTAFLQALEKLNPINTAEDYDPLVEYPRRRFKRYENTRHEDNPDPVASARYELSDTEKDLIEAEHGGDILNDSLVTVVKDYKNHLHWEVDVDESQLCENLLEQRDLQWKNADFLREAESVQNLLERIEESDASGDDFERLKTEVEALQQGPGRKIGSEILEPRLPEFVYFDEYSLMDGKVNIPQLNRRQSQNNLTNSDETFLSLVSIAGLSLQDMSNVSNFERTIAELEASSNLISDQVFEYWSQGPDLEVQFKKSEQNGSGARQQNQNQNNNGPVLHVRVRNNRHRVSVSFDERSSGFIWFFSFLSYFSDLDASSGDLILLLDEPGLNLHAKAQYDFLRFINERLAPDHPVVYTTHSPFMLESGNLHRARLVVDDPEEGTQVSEDILGTDEDTRFPLQAALGYDLIRTLLIGPECLLVEGKSDMTYFQLMSDILEDQGRTPLSHRWTIVPVNGADNVPTFVSLFGASDLEIAVVLDDDSRIDQRLREIESRGVLDTNNVYTISDFLGGDEGDSEDLFSKEFYLELVNHTYRYDLQQKRTVPTELSLDDIENKHPRVTKRLEMFFEKQQISGGRFEHHKPASHFQKNRSHFEEELDEETLDRFETLFEALNSVLE